MQKLFYRIIRFFFTQYFHTLNQWHLCKIKKEMPVKTIKNIYGFKMILDLKNDRGISRDLYFRGVHEKTSAQYLLNSSVLKKGDVALDIGANIGYYALIESKKVGTLGKVYAIEPVTKNYKRLQQNIALNNISNISTFNFAAGDHDGPADIYVNEKSNRSSIINSDPEHIMGAEKVKMFKIDTFLKDKRLPNFIRMDVEGYEYAILEGMVKTMNNIKRALIHIEIHPDIMSEEQILRTFSIIENTGFTEVTVLYQPYDGWLNSSGIVRPIINRLTKKIGDIEKLSQVKPTNFDILKKMILKEKKQLRIIFSKNLNKD
jgi:FkbM family methyltransferase